MTLLNWDYPTLWNVLRLITSIGPLADASRNWIPARNFVALAHPRIARQGEVIPREDLSAKESSTNEPHEQNKRIHRNLIFLPRSGIEPGTSGNSDIAMTTTPSAHGSASNYLTAIVSQEWNGLFMQIFKDVSFVVFYRRYIECEWVGAAIPQKKMH